MESKKFILQEKDIPTAWYNVLADMPVKPRPILNPATKKPLTPEDLYPIFSQEASRQELNDTDKWIEIPDEVREMYRIWRPTPLVRARGLEKVLDTPAHIYFKNESVSPVGSHKLNSAIPQAYYCKKEGVTNITTETGAGQWGAALSLAARHFGLELAVYMVNVSYHQKPYPPLNNANLRSRSHRVAEHVDQSRTQNHYRTPQLPRLTRHSYFRSSGTGFIHAKLQICSRLSAQPCVSSSDSDRA